MVFLNDLFPKDFQSFFIGRDEEYLKAPSDSLKISFFPSAFNMDVVWGPLFNSDRFVSGERPSYFSSILKRKGEEDNQVNDRKPDDWVTDSELALRVFKNLRGYELAFYGYYGFFKNPGGFDSAGRAIFPRLEAFGSSIRGPVLGGIGNLEFAYYDSLDDRNGTDLNINNSEVRFLAGFNREVVANFSIGLQYNIETGPS